MKYTILYYIPRALIQLLLTFSIFPVCTDLDDQTRIFQSPLDEKFAVISKNFETPPLKFGHSLIENIFKAPTP